MSQKTDLREKIVILILSRDLMTIVGFWIDDRIYFALIQLLTASKFYAISVLHFTSHYRTH
jgi:hypothetical protein